MQQNCRVSTALEALLPTPRAPIQASRSILRVSDCPASSASRQRQAWLAAVRRLDLALLVGTQHNRVFWRVQVEYHEVLEFLLKLRIRAGRAGFELLKARVLPWNASSAA